MSYLIQYMCVLPQDSLDWPVHVLAKVWEAEMDNDRTEWVNSEGGGAVGRLWASKRGDVFAENEEKLEVNVRRQW